MSGKAEFAHLHIQLRRDETIVDPFSGEPMGAPCGSAGGSAWAPGSGVRYEPLVLQSVGFADGPVTRDELVADTASPAVLPSDGAALVIWAQAFGVRTGDRLTLRIQGPAGRTVVEKTVEITKYQAYRMAFVGRRTRTAAGPPAPIAAWRSWCGRMPSRPSKPGARSRSSCARRPGRWRDGGCDRR